MRPLRISPLSPPLLVSLSSYMEILSQFLLRLAFGLAVGMAITSPQQVFSGFYRNHLYVTLGLTTLAALVRAQSIGGLPCRPFVPPS